MRPISTRLLLRPRLRAAILLLFVAAAAGTAETVYRYRELVGDAESIGIYRVRSTSSGLHMEYSGGGERHLIACDPRLDTVSWEHERDDGTASASATRTGSRIAIRGTRGGAAFAREKDAGGLPWFQAPDYQLSSLLRAEAGSSRSFWMILPSDYSFYKMKATVRGVERIVVGGVARQARRISVAVDGLPEAVWRNEYWYDERTGLYLESRGRRGPPWTPLIRLQFLGMD